MPALDLEPFAPQQRRYAIDPVSETLHDLRPDALFLDCFVDPRIEHKEQFGRRTRPAGRMLGDHEITDRDGNGIGLE